MLPQFKYLMYFIGLVFFIGSVITIVYEVIAKPYKEKKLQQKFDSLTLTKKKTDMDEEKEDQNKKRQDDVEILGLEKQVRYRIRKDKEKLEKKENSIVYSSDSLNGYIFKDEGKRIVSTPTSSSSTTQEIIQEQDREYMESLFLDQRKEQSKKEIEKLEQLKLKEKIEALELLRNNLVPEPTIDDKDINIADITKILIKFPDGENKTRKFLKNHKVQDIIDYVNSLDILNDKEFELIFMSYPKKILNRFSSTLEEYELHPSCSLYIQLK